MKKIKHLKLKNTGILFELLSRQVTVDLMENISKPTSVSLMKKYFNKKTELGKELQLYQLLVKESCPSENKAEYLLEKILKVRTSLNNSKLKREKYNFIKDIKEKYPIKEFFNAKIKDYKILASIYKMFDLETLSEGYDPKDSADTKYTVIEHLMSHSTTKRKTVKESKKIAKLKQESEDVRLLTYKILVDNFNDRYKNLDSHQKKLLREYINNLSNSNGLKEYIGKEVKRVKKQLIGLIKKVDDKVTAIKLKESTNQLDNLQLGNFVKDSQVLNLMRYYELVKELKKCVSPNSKK
tara:strand:+ start:3538 stop:4425 length:888 start_codon:yes stop_codon:yes gene_type:complete